MIAVKRLSHTVLSLLSSANMLRKVVISSVLAGGAYVYTAPPLRSLRPEQERLPRSYDSEIIASFWKDHPRQALRRSLDILSTVVPLYVSVMRGLYSGLLGGARAEASALETGVPRDKAAEVQAQKDFALQLRKALTTLGPTFIKLGQVLSTRPDLLPQPLLDELITLCSSVPTFPTRQALEIIEGDLGVGAVERLFIGLDEDTVPVAGASLGQVYKVQLRPDAADANSGAGANPVTIALKVQRPDAFLSLALDLHLLLQWARMVETSKAAIGGAAETLSGWKFAFRNMRNCSSSSSSSSGGGDDKERVWRYRQKDFDVLLVKTFAAASWRELDYEAEASNQELFARVLPGKMELTAAPASAGAGSNTSSSCSNCSSDGNTGWLGWLWGSEARSGNNNGNNNNNIIFIPPVYRQATARHVLATQWVEGTRMDQAPRETVAKLIPVGVHCFMCQLLDMGVFHSDPHPGNMLVTPEGKLALIDFGLCASISAPDSNALTAAMVNLMKGDVPALLKDCQDLGFLDAGALSDPAMHAELLAVMERVVDVGEMSQQNITASNSAKKLLTAQMVGDAKYEAPAERRRKLHAVSSDLNSIFFEYPFSVPEYFALITRALIVLEGVAVTADNNFDIFAAAYPHALSRTTRIFGVENLSRLLRAKMVGSVNASHPLAAYGVKTETKTEAAQNTTQAQAQAQAQAQVDALQKLA